MEKVAARYVYTLDGGGPIRDGYVEYGPDGVVAGVGQCSDPDSETRKIALSHGFESVDDFMNYLMVRRADDTDSETQS